MTSRRSHSAVNAPAIDGEPTVRAAVRALDAALQAEDEDEHQDDQHRADDEDPGLAQRLAEEPQDAARRRRRRITRPEKRSSRPRPAKPSRAPSAQRPHRTADSSGWVASSVWVKT